MTCPFIQSPPKEDEGEKNLPGDNWDGYLDQGMAQYFIGSLSHDLTPTNK